MPLIPSASARQAQDQHALGDTFTAMGRRHNGLCYWFARVNGIGLLRDSCHCRQTDKDGNRLTMPEGYQLAGIGPALLWTSYLQAPHPRQYIYRLQYTVYKSNLDPGIFSLEYWSSALDSLPSTDRQVDRASTSHDGTESPGFLRLRAGQLSWTFAASWISLQ